MEFSDYLWLALILAGTLYLLYRSLFKKKGRCSGCNSESCDSADKPKP